MAFNSFSFLVFILVVFIVYFLMPGRLRWLVLLIASIVFYIFSTGWMVVYLAAATIITFFAAILLDKNNVKKAEWTAQDTGSISKQEKKERTSAINRRKKRILTLALVLVFSILGFMKYYDFLAVNISALFNRLALGITLPTYSLLLPLGISFFTFQSAGYVIDVSRGKVKAERSLARYALFVSFFPQIVQGPISRYDRLADQLYEPHDFDYTRAKFGLQLMLWGLFKKMVMADRLMIAVDTIFNNYKEYNGLIIFMGAAMYSLQVYCDFSGGIDIARGVAQVMGIDLPENFKRPFFATSVEDFWRRWHITLSSWMRDYVFYPLSLSKAFVKIGRSSRKRMGNYLGKLFPTFLATMITFTLVGVWHGPDWKFVAYGAYNGFLIFMGILIGPYLDNLIEKYHVRTQNFSWRFLKILGTFVLITIGRYFSRAESFWTAQNMMRWTVLKFNPWVFFDGTLLNLGLDGKDIAVVVLSILVLLVVSIFQESGVQLREKIAQQNLVFRWSLYLAAIFAVVLLGIYGSAYNNIDFIYEGF